VNRSNLILLEPLKKRLVHNEKFGRLLADSAWNLINSCSVRVTSLAALPKVYGIRNDYALHEVAGNGVHTP
jgi:hypothetical protein